jgi:hypothetical protein
MGRRSGQPQTIQPNSRAFVFAASNANASDSSRRTEASLWTAIWGVCKVRSIGPAETPREALEGRKFDDAF